MKGYGGRILFVDCTTGAFRIEPLSEAVARARSEGRPTLVELITYRFRGHSMSDPAKYRQKEEVDRWRRNDPLERTSLALQQIFGVPEAELEAIDEVVVQEMDAAYEFADRAPLPEPAARFANVMAEGPWYGDSVTTRPADRPASPG